ncbi:MAG: sugar phosphate isomerase/epimerase [Planctomycetota bacterium]|nr:MAG: sugar phosphate isomerase/epimerase [Planctomycetota bacterium]
MQLTLSTHLLVYSRLEDGVLGALARSGFETVELWLAEPHVPWRDLQATADLRARLEHAGLRAASVHLPFYPSVAELRDQGRKWSVLAQEREQRRIAVAGAAQGLRAAAVLGATRAVLHLGWQKDVWTPQSHAWARDAVAALLPPAREHGVTLLLENIISEGTRARRLVALLDELDPAGEAGVCLDLGHAHVEGGVLSQLQDALPRLRHLHVHDNDGGEDQHLCPGQGSIPWAEVLGFLQRAGYGGQGALEIRDASAGRDSAAQILEREGAQVRGFQQQWSRHGLLPAPAPAPRRAPDAAPPRRSTP